MKDYNFAKEAFAYEIANYKYDYNLQADWDVFSCFGTVKFAEDKDYRDYAQELEMTNGTLRAFKDALKEYYKEVKEHF